MSFSFQYEHERQSSPRGLTFENGEIKTVIDISIIIL